MTKKPSFGIPQRVSTCLVILTSGTTLFGGFSEYFSFCRSLAASCSFLTKKQVD